MTETREDFLWCGRRLSELSREELETALWQTYCMYADSVTPDAIEARGRELAKKKVEEWKK